MNVYIKVVVEKGKNKSVIGLDEGVKYSIQRCP